eukprot:g39293.t1
MLPDVGKEPFGHLVLSAPRGLNAQWRSEKLLNRGFGEETSQQLSDGKEEEEDDLISNGQGASESGPGESLDLRLAEQLDAAGLENNVTLVLERSSSRAYDVQHVSMSDPVKDVRLHRLPNGVICLGTDADLADSMIELEVHVIQDSELQDLELPMVLCESSEHLIQMIGGNDEDPVLAEDPGAERLPQTSKQQEGMPASSVETSPDTMTRGKLRKTTKSDETPVSEQLDNTETSCQHHRLETQLQAAENQGSSTEVQQKQERLLDPSQESQFLTQQTGVEQGVRRIKTRGKVTAGKESNQVVTSSKGAKEPENPSPPESQPALGGCSSPQSVEPQSGHGDTLVNEVIHPEQTLENGPAPAPQHPGTTSSPTSRLPGCDMPSPAVPETTINESKLRSISLQQYRLRLQQRKRDGVLSVHEKQKLGTDTNSKSAWPVVPIQSIVQGELSILPLEPAGH